MTGVPKKWSNVYEFVKETSYFEATFKIPPNETFNYQVNVKCFTFFSYITDIWKEIRIDLQQMTIHINPIYNWIPPHIIERYYLAIHSPKSIPEFDYGITFNEVKPNTISFVTFNKINVDVETENNCHNYDNGELLRSDCIAICVMKKVQNKYGRLNAITTKFLLRKDYSKYLPAYNQTGHNQSGRRDIASEFKPECMQQCKQDCSFEYYIYDIKPGAPISNQEYYRQSMIHINHKQIPDIYIKHIPETTFISFISNFGGLLGMWLGISVILIFENIFKFSKNVIEKFCKPNSPMFINRNNIQLIQNPNYQFNQVKIQPICICTRHKNDVGDLPPNTVECDSSGIINCEKVN